MLCPPLSCRQVNKLSFVLLHIISLCLFLLTTGVTIPHLPVILSFIPLRHFTATHFAPFHGDAFHIILLHHFTATYSDSGRHLDFAVIGIFYCRQIGFAVIWFFWQSIRSFAIIWVLHQNKLDLLRSLDLPSFGFFTIIWMFTIIWILTSFQNLAVFWKCAAIGFLPSFGFMPSFGF